ncbi:MAG: hypothetical protein NTY90_05605 [Candidatus Micrarchaeota archaeon]|nr:hypothetical protein [Candidatus Micrarchaeota archaeon]
MENVYVTVQEFKKLENQVKALLEVHESDLVLSAREKKLVEEVKADLGHGRLKKFTNATEL